MVLFISSGEIFFILLAILIFFGAGKIPEFARMMGKGVREFKKATDDIKREFNENSSGIMDDIKSIRDDMTGIGNDMTHTLTREIVEPVQETADETAKTFDEYKDQYNTDYYYDNPYDIGNSGSEYLQEVQEASPETIAESAAETPDSQQTGTTKPAEA
ncbi:MAG: twin-arginine translocase TatA/TatE family subunit [Bacteroidales bacterium]|nr:twin-arginine translocase TatA/TatE family subunit [Bacteroidales bacterium]